MQFGELLLQSGVYGAVTILVCEAAQNWNWNWRPRPIPAPAMNHQFDTTKMIFPSIMWCYF